MYNSRLYYNQDEDIKKTNRLFGTPTMQKNMFDLGVSGSSSGGFSFNRGSLMNRPPCSSGGYMSGGGKADRLPLPQMVFEPTTLYVNGNSMSLPENRIIRSGGKMIYPKPLMKAIKKSKLKPKK
jgi:hypothetical protein